MDQKRMLAFGRILFVLSFLFIFSGLYLEFESRGSFSDPITDTTIIAGLDDEIIISTTDDDYEIDLTASEDEVKVYFFYGRDCNYSEAAMIFFKSLEKEYGKKFTVISYEVWKNHENAILYDKVAKVNEVEVDGVPYIVIGNKSWVGYDSSYDDAIISAILSEYEVKVDDRYDVISIINEQEKPVDTPQTPTPVPTPEPSEEPQKPSIYEHTHSYTSTVINPTCTLKGYTVFTCSCGHSYTSNQKPALGHKYKSEVIPPTTAAGGYTLHVCTVCGHTYQDSFTEKLPSEEPTPPAVPTIEETNNALRKTIESTYGIEVKYGSETDGYTAGTMRAVSISDPAVIQNGLNQLNASLALYPSGFFSEFGETGLHLKVYLVQRYSTANVTGITDLAGDRVIISISMDYSFAESFHHEAYHYIEHFVERKGGEFSIWNTYNPSDFSYGGTANPDLSYNRTWAPTAPFVNNYAQTNADEDRASTFEYMTAASKASCFNSTEYPIWKKSSYMSLMIDTYFDTVSPSVVDYWERFIY